MLASWSHAGGRIKIPERETSREKNYDTQVGGIEREVEKGVDKEGERPERGGEMLEKEGQTDERRVRGVKSGRNSEQGNCVSDGSDKELGGRFEHPTKVKNCLPLPLIFPLFNTLYNLFNT